MMLMLLANTQHNNKECKMDRHKEWNHLVDLLHQADAVQQKLLANQHAAASYEFHCQLNMIADELIDFARAEHINIA
jgi:hypothetical protein